MPKYRDKLPQLSGDLFLSDAGMETDLIFNHGIEITEFASHTLLPDPLGRAKLTEYFRAFLALASSKNAGFILDAPTWKAHNHWRNDLGCSENDLIKANHDCVNFIKELRDTSGNPEKIVLNAITGPCGDAYAPEDLISVEDAEKYHGIQLNWLLNTEIDMVTAMTFTQSTEAAGYAIAASEISLPCVISFTVETDGRLPSGQSLQEAIDFVDRATNSYPSYFMINCAHPDHFEHILANEDWAKRIRGLRCNASRCSHAELDACQELDDGDPKELADQYQKLKTKLPWLNVFGGCCGSDIRHITEIVKAIY